MKQSLAHCQCLIYFWWTEFSKAWQTIAFCWPHSFPVAFCSILGTGAAGSIGRRSDVVKGRWPEGWERSLQSFLAAISKSSHLSWRGQGEGRGKARCWVSSFCSGVQGEVALCCWELWWIPVWSGNALTLQPKQGRLQESLRSEYDHSSGLLEDDLLHPTFLPGKAHSTRQPQED